MKKNLLYSFLYELIIAFYPLLMIPYLSNVIGKSGTGIYSYTYSIMGVFLLVCQLGVNTCGVRAIAQNRDDRVAMTKTFKSIFFIQVCSGLLSIIVYVSAFVIADNKYNLYFLLLLPFLIGQCIRISWFFLGLEQIQVILLRNVLIRVVSALLIFLFVKSENSLPLYFIIMSASYLIGDISVLPKAMKYLSLDMPSKEDIKKYIKPMFIMFIPIIALRGAYYIDEIMLGFMRDTDCVAIYENAYKVINMPLQLYTVLANVLTAQASYLIAVNKEKENRTYIINSIDLSSAVMIPIIAGLISVSNELIPWYMGKQFLASIEVMHILPFVLIFSGINNILRTQYFIPMNQDNKYINTVLAGVFINIALNALFVTKYAYNGVAIATVISEAIVTAASIMIIKKDFDLASSFRNFPSYILIAVVMAAAVRFIGNAMGAGVLTSIVQVAAGGLVYMLILLLFQRLFRRRDTVSLYRIIIDSLSKIKSRIRK